MKLIWVTQAEYVRDYILSLTFNDGVHKMVDLKDHLSGEVFEPLRNLEQFKKFKVSEWSIEWENGADLAPEFLYAL